MDTDLLLLFGDDMYAFYHAAAMHYKQSDYLTARIMYESKRRIERELNKHIDLITHSLHEYRLGLATSRFTKSVYIMESHLKITQMLRDNPSLRAYYDENYFNRMQNVVRKLAKAVGKAESQMIIETKWSSCDILNKTWLLTFLSKHGEQYEHQEDNNAVT